MEHALRGILDAGGDIREEWDVEDALKSGDRATGANVLQPLYNKMKDTPVGVDLDALWLQLGVQSSGASVRFDDSAKLAAIRRAITSAESTSSEEQSLLPKSAAIFAGRSVGGP